MPFHPLVVHFPIVLFILAGVLYAYMIGWREAQYEKLTGIIHVAGLLFTAIAIFSGQQSEGQLSQTPELRAMLEQHARFAWICVWLYGLLYLWTQLRFKRWKMMEKYAFLAVFLITTSVLGYSAHLGGKMVYEKGAGVLPMKEKLEEEGRKE